MRNFVALGILAGVSAASPVIYMRVIDIADQARAASVSAQAAQPEIVATGNAAKPRMSGRAARIEADRNGHYSAQFKFNGRRLDALVDTGATVVAINVSTARKIGITLVASDFKHSVSTANGRVKAAAVLIDAVEIGRVRLENVEAVVLDDRALQTTLIGMSALNRLARYKVEDNILVLEQ